MDNKDVQYVELFEGAPYCARCEMKLRLLGSSTVTCGHTSFIIGIDKLTNHAYNDWMAVESDLVTIVGTR